MGKSRSSHCNQENRELVEEIQRKTEVFKKKFQQSNEPKIKVEPKKKPVKPKSSEVKPFRTPKILIGLKKEASYAVIPKAQESKLVQFAIRKEVELFKNIPRKQDGSTKEGKRGESNQHYQTL